MNDCTEQSFLKDVAKHEMTILREDGVHRHVRFKIPGDSSYYFDLITWPGYLCFTGDMGTYVFRRLEDMFVFFRTDREHMAKSNGQPLGVNLSYWAEKVEAVDKHGAIKEFSDELCNRVVKDDLFAWMRENTHRTTKEERRDLWEEIIRDILDISDSCDASRKQAAIHDFSHHVNDQVGEFYFKDFWEHNVMEYTYHFTWCCYALAWGIQQYDNSKGQAA